MSSWLPVKPKLKLFPHHILKLRKEKLAFSQSVPVTGLFFPFLVHHSLSDAVSSCYSLLYPIVPRLNRQSWHSGPQSHTLQWPGSSQCPGDNVNNIQDWRLDSENIKIAPFPSFLLFFKNISEIHILKHLKNTYTHRTNSTWLDMWRNERVCHILQ